MTDRYINPEDLGRKAESQMRGFGKRNDVEVFFGGGRMILGFWELGQKSEDLNFEK